MVNGKAKLMRDDYCDGFGDCLPGCPTGAITFEEREAAAYDEQAVLENKQKKAAAGRRSKQPPHGCPGCPDAPVGPAGGSRKRRCCPRAARAARSCAQWPCQIKLVPVRAPYFDGRKAADRRRLHGLRLRQCPSRSSCRGKITLIGCPKLDAVDYSEKLTEIIAQQRHPERDHPAHGGALLRRAGTRPQRPHCSTAESLFRGRW